jgi:hypothetical protein
LIFANYFAHPCHFQTQLVILFVTFRKQLVEESAVIRISNAINRECIERCANQQCWAKAIPAFIVAKIVVLEHSNIYYVEVRTQQIRNFSQIILNAVPAIVCAGHFFMASFHELRNLSGNVTRHEKQTSPRN